MTSNIRTVEGIVNILLCDKCNHKFPHVTLAGESDLDTAGIYSVTSVDKNEIVVAELNIEEWTNFSTNGLKLFEKRMNLLFKRSDLRTIYIKKIIDDLIPESKDKRFSSFLNTYTPPSVIFSCIKCDSGNGKIINEITLYEFIEDHGKILTFGNITLI